MDFVAARRRAQEDDQDRIWHAVVMGSSAKLRCRATSGARQLQRIFEPCGGALELGEAISEGYFAPVPAALIGEFSGWRTVLSGRWREPCEILRGEGKAAVLGFRHALRSQHGLQKRIVLLTDNLAFALGVAKGRGSHNILNSAVFSVCTVDSQRAESGR